MKESTNTPPKEIEEPMSTTDPSRAQECEGPVTNASLQMQDQNGHIWSPYPHNTTTGYWCNWCGRYTYGVYYNPHTHQRLCTAHFRAIGYVGNGAIYLVQLLGRKRNDGIGSRP